MAVARGGVVLLAVVVAATTLAPASVGLVLGRPDQVAADRMVALGAAPAAAAAAPKTRKPPPFTGKGLTLGDSVMKGARKELAALNYTVDAVGSRQPSAGYAALVAYGRRLPALVVIHMGTNAGITRAWFDKYMRLLGPERRVVWVTLQLRNDYTRYTYEARSNAVIRAAVKAYPNARLFDWNKVSEAHSRAWLIADGIHLTFAGRRAYAALINAVARA